MPTFRAPLVPGIGQYSGAVGGGVPIPQARPVSAPATAAPAPLAQSTGEALTLDALMARQKNAAVRQQSNMEQPVTNIPQGLGQLAWTLVNALQERRAEKDLQQGNADVANAFKQVDWNTGQLPPEAMSALMQRDPATGIEMYKTAMALRASQSKTDSWTQIPTPEGENGQWYQNQNGETKKVGGGTDSGIKDESALRQDVISDGSYKNLAQAVPIWQSITEATTHDTAQADLNIILGMAKLFDPTSVVRTSEGEQVQQTGDLPTEIYSQWAYLTGEPGSRLKPEVKDGLLREGWSRMKGYRDAYGQTSKTYTEIAKRHGFNPENVALPFAEIKPYGEDTPPDPNNPNPPDPNNPPAPDTPQPDAAIPEIAANDTEAYMKLPVGAQYKIPGDPTIYTKQAKQPGTP